MKVPLDCRKRYQIHTFVYSTLLSGVEASAASISSALTANAASFLELAAQLKTLLTDRPGFISVERFQSLVDEGKMLSLPFWEDEESVAACRNLMEHRAAQRRGKEGLFSSYRIRIAEVTRDYTDSDRDQAPADSTAALGS